MTIDEMTTSMTLIGRSIRECALCGRSFEGREVYSISTWNHDELCGKPSGDDEEVLELVIEKCPYCNYCESSVSEKTDIDPDILKTSGYLYILSSDLPETARHYRASAFIHYRTGDKLGGIVRDLRAAWCTKDDRRLMMEYNVAKKILELERIPSGLLIAAMDIFRRKGDEVRFSQVIDHMNKTKENIPKGLLEMQIRLIEERDSDIHTMDEIKRG